MCLPGDRCSGQGQHNQTRNVGPEPPRMWMLQFQDPFKGRTRSRLPVALLQVCQSEVASGSSIAHTTRKSWWWCSPRVWKHNNRRQRHEARTSGNTASRASTTSKRISVDNGTVILSLPQRIKAEQRANDSRNGRTAGGTEVLAADVKVTSLLGSRHMDLLRMLQTTRAPNGLLGIPADRKWFTVAVEDHPPSLKIS